MGGSNGGEPILGTDGQLSFLLLFASGSCRMARLQSRSDGGAA